MVITRKRTPPTLAPIYLNNTQIGESTSIISLGVTITRTLNWNEHIYKQISKASKRMFILHTYRNILPRSSLECIYTSMIRPVLEFGDVLYDSLSLSTVHALETIQRQAAVICSGAYRHTRHKNLLLELGWEPLAERRRYHKLCLFYKIVHRIYPPYLHNLLQYNTQNTYNLRNPTTLIPRHTRLKSSFHSFFPSCTREWNNLPTSTQQAISTNTFKSLIRAKPPTNKKYNTLCTGIHGRWLSRLRMNLSALNHHRFTYNFIPSSLCPCCSTHSETTKHYFFHCPTHRLARTRLSFRLELELEMTVDNEDKLLETILFGKFINPNNYSKLLDIVFQYISSTGRFA